MRADKSPLRSFALRKGLRKGRCLRATEGEEET
jgi:hypothetical protein